VEAAVGIEKIRTKPTRLDGLRSGKTTRRDSVARAGRYERQNANKKKKNNFS